MKLKKKYLLAIFAWIFMILCITCSSCGPAYYLNHSKKDITKAIAKGANLKSDTTYAKRTFKFDGAKTSLSLQPYLLRKDGTRVVMKDTTIYQDKIKTVFKDNNIYVECPPDTVTVEIPVKVDQEIQAGYTKWYVIKTVAGFSLFFLVLGFLVSKITKL